MKTFAQFLIDEGFASKDNVLTALVMQSEALPSLPSALVAMQVYGTEQMLDIFAHQAIHATEFRAAAIALGLWNEARLRKLLDDFYAEKIRPIGDILLEQGAITMEQLADALSRYVTVCDESSWKTLKTSSQKIHASDKKLYYLYCRHFDQQRYAALKNCLEHLTVQDRAMLSREILTLRTAAHTMLADISVQLADAMLMSLESPSCIDARDALLQVFELLWQLREAMAEGVSESGFLADKNQTTIDSMCRNLSLMGESA